MTAKERLSLVLEQHCKTSIRSIEKHFKWGNGSLMKPGTLNLRRLEKIRLKYPEINLCWILFGQGEMLVQEPGFPEISVAAEPQTEYKQKCSNCVEMKGRLEEARRLVFEKDQEIAKLNREIGSINHEKNKGEQKIA